jgi:hypothetical protein
MSHPRTLTQVRLTFALAAAMLFHVKGLAQTTHVPLSGTNLTGGLALSVLPGEAVGREQVIRALIRSGTNEFIFVVPDGLRVQTAPDGTIVMTSQDLTYSVTLRLKEPAPDVVGLAGALAECVKHQYPDGGGQERFTAIVAGREGTGIQLQQKLQGLNPRLVRVLWVPFRPGLMEFVLSADNSSASAAKAALDMIMLTFRSNEGGKLEIMSHSDRS